MKIEFHKSYLSFVTFIIFSIMSALIMSVPDANAYERYNDGCKNCHGEFSGGTSPKNSNFHNQNKMDMHRDSDSMNSDCDLCHSSGSKKNPYIGSSHGTSENPGLGCTGCHGREEDAGNDSVSAGLGAGQRQHHWNANKIIDTPIGPVSSRVCGDCHSDADPANYTPVGEHVKPRYFGTGNTNVDGPCNPIGQQNLNENWSLNDFRGLDNDGDGMYDLNDPDCGGLPLCTDSDNDGYINCDGTCAPGTLLCGDCNDGDGSLNPDASELCDGMDNDCDGSIDEDFIDLGTGCNVGAGACQTGGTYVCTADGSDVECDAVPGTPSTEICDGIDNDCDSSTDEDFPNLGTACTAGIGACESAGNYICTIDGSGTECDATPGAPGIEGPEGDPTCSDTIDNDCDNLIDSNDPDCPTCIPTGTPETICNGIDDDCDGPIDEDYTPASTTCGVGECASAGQTTCVGGVEGDTCTPGTPSAEICDGLDNNCDNAIDEFYTNLGTSCTVGVGACEAAGIYICAADGIGTECDATPGTPGVEGPEGDPTCSDTIDNDCDNLTDSNDPDCPVCTPTGTPETICNGIDDDCDDLIDEDFVGSTTACGVGICASNGLIECINGLEQDSCVAGAPGIEGPQGDPTCSDGDDNDCDGLTDAAQDSDCAAVVQVPPPVQQNIGFPDRATGDLIEDDCRYCHQDPNIVNGANIPDRHHLLALQPDNIPPASLIFVGTCSVSGDFCRSDAECPITETCNIPFAPVDPDANKDGNPDTTYACLSCHPNDPGTPDVNFTVTRDCILCHSAFSPHHMTAQAQAQNCDACHGPVDNPFDGHPVGQNPPSMVTPNRCCGSGLPAHMKEDGSPVFAGGCDYCHDTGLTSGDAANGIVAARTSEQLHHDTGLFDQQPAVCDWCHQFEPVAIDNPDPFDIRTCERCHGISSLHNILVDSDATGLVDTTGDGVGDTENLGNIIPNFENDYFGHVGNSDDCWGCHGYGAAESNPATGPIIPYIYLLSAYSVHEGTDTTLTITGSSLRNTVFTPQGPVAINSVAVLTADNGTETTLATLAFSETSMEVTVPGTLAPGSYVLRAVKDISDSNAVGFTVVPAVTLTDVNCERKKGILTITGSGFTEKPEGTDVYLNVQINGVVIGLADLISWSDSQIRVSVDRCSRRDAVSVNALFGSASDGKPCKDKRCR